MPRLPKLIIKGDKELIRKLKRLGDKRKLKKVLRQATNAAAQQIVRGVRSVYPEDTGFSRKSVTKKIITTQSGYSAIVGVDANAVAIKPNGQKHIPHKIDHLIEFGWQEPDGTTVAGKHPLRRGFDGAKAAADAKFAEKAGQAIEKEAMRK
jgi:hypothetical protein